MLPGGLQVLGVLLVDSTGLSNSSAFKKKVETILKSIESLNAKTSFSTLDDPNGEVSLYALLIDRSSKNSNCQVAQIAQPDQNGIMCKDTEIKWKHGDLKV